MIMNSRDKDVEAKQEAESSDSKIISSRAAPSTSRQWAGFKNPRIVRVSRSFGGKDRHSKVCTIRGLRDRRIRLSVPTAIQLYDLQDRLGLGQPSKVVDWLIDATKDDIDKLPPLQMPPGSNFSQFHPPQVFSQESIAPPQASMSHFFNANSSTMKDANTRKGIININDHFDGNDQTSLEGSRFWNSDAASTRAKNKEDERDESATGNGENEQENLDQNNFGGYVTQVSAQNFFPVGNHHQSSFPYNNPYLQWDPSNLSLSQLGNHTSSVTFQAEDSSQNSIHQYSLAFPPSAGSQQLYFCPSLPSIVPPYPPHQYINTTASVENEARQINHFQLLSSTSQHHVVPNNNSLIMPTLHLMSSPMTLTLNATRPKLPNDHHSQMNEGDS